MKAHNPIHMINENEFELVARGQHMTLFRKGDDWEMWTTNATTRAWGGPSIKVFPSLEAVEAKYKTWKGITKLVALSSMGGNGEQAQNH
ncbi:hypothetical protein [Marinobacter sp. MBR-105]|jgi:hypothetical protein